MTLDTYSHVAPGLQEAAAKRFDEFISASRGIDPKTFTSAVKLAGQATNYPAKGGCF